MAASAIPWVSAASKAAKLCQDVYVAGPPGVYIGYQFYRMPTAGLGGLALRRKTIVSFVLQMPGCVSGKRVLNTPNPCTSGVRV